MEEKELAKVQATIERCIRRSEKIEKKLQQPWRNVPESAKAHLQESVKALNGLLPEVETRTSEYLKTKVCISVTMAKSMELDLKRQNFQKVIGEEVTPFGKFKIG